ncbi:zinc finger, GRF-type [Artemisia annua]|uniref:Zinc finger, GRF-type n=1 Tax=Artemisia annua TaxID=35608 RepID=A0A2U1MLZ7_ARTAN|nr:zinc finger, GRF-type [Artemisia annua]
MTVVRCHCGRVAIVKTSWTNANPGRRFYSCPIPDSNCRWIDWYDPPMCNRSLVIIPGLLRSRNNMEGAIIEAQNGRAKMKKYLIWSWILFVVLFSIK